MQQNITFTTFPFKASVKMVNLSIRKFTICSKMLCLLKLKCWRFEFTGVLRVNKTVNFQARLCFCEFNFHL